MTESSAASPPDSRVTAIEALSTLFALGREVTSVLDLNELLQKIPQIIGRITKFQAFAVYLLDRQGEELTIAYSVGYPEDVARTLRVKVGHGLVGAAVAGAQPILVNDVRTDPRYVEAVPGSHAELVVPLRRKGRVLGALNLLSDTVGQFTETDEAILRQFAAHVAVAIENARLFEHEREYTSTLETLADIAGEFGAILDPDELLTRIASLTRRVVDYRTFGIVLVNEETQELEMKVAVRYGEKVELPRVKVGSGLVGYAALHKEAVLVPDVSVDPRYIKVVDDVRSELVIPLLLKDRCIGVFDLESPELDAFTKGHVEILTLLASQAAVAIENARLYETIRANEIRLAKELRFAQRVQAALLPSGSAQAPQGRRRCGAVHTGARAWRRSLRFSRARAERSGRGGRRRVRQGRSGGALQRICRGAGPLADVPPALHARPFEPRGRPGVDEHHPARAPARGVLLHAVLCGVRFQAPHGGPGEFRPAVSDSLFSEGGSRRGRRRIGLCLADRAARRSARIVRWILLRRGCVRSRGRRRCMCSAVTACSKRVTRPAGNSARDAWSTWSERTAKRVRASWSTRSSRRWTHSEAKRRRTTT